jgi:hypothetical protein
MKAFVTTMKYPLSQDPAKTIAAEKKCPRGESLFSPKRNSPRNADSAKNANIPSSASVRPMTPPVASLKRAQFVPNWNSIGIPVTTPSAKLIPKMRAQKRARSSKRASFVRNAAALSTTRMRASPIVSCGNR